MSFLCWCLGKNRAITMIDMSSMRLVDAPPEIFEHSKTLQVLLLGANRIKDVPKVSERASE